VKFTRRLFYIVIAATLAALPALYSTAQQQVGVTSTTAGDPRGTPPAENERILKVGADIKANERVRTAANDRAHLVFDDGSALTVGVDSDLVIDRFVYDPATQTGDLTMTTTRGAFRFVGGAISKKKEVVIHTPSADIGIRGAIGTWAIGPDGSVTATFLYGEQMWLRNALGAQFATRYGSQIFVPQGGRPTPPFVLPPNSLQAYLKVFEHDQAAGNIVGPGDRAALDALLAGLNPQKLPYTNFDPALLTWLTYLQAVASQGIATTNANRPGPLKPNTRGTCFGNC
jgi:hypothetical protein